MFRKCFCKEHKKDDCRRKEERLYYMGKIKKRCWLDFFTVHEKGLSIITAHLKRGGLFLFTNICISVIMNSQI